MLQISIQSLQYKNITLRIKTKPFQIKKIFIKIIINIQKIMY